MVNCYIVPKIYPLCQQSLWINISLLYINLVPHILLCMCPNCGIKIIFLGGKLYGKLSTLYHYTLSFLNVVLPFIWKEIVEIYRNINVQLLSGLTKEIVWGLIFLHLTSSFQRSITLRILSHISKFQNFGQVTDDVIMRSRDVTWENKNN